MYALDMYSSVFSWISLAETATGRPQEGHMGDETLRFLRVMVHYSTYLTMLVRMLARSFISY
jgi:hypothetical protein